MDLYFSMVVKMYKEHIRNFLFSWSDNLWIFLLHGSNCLYNLTYSLHCRPCSLCRQSVPAAQSDSVHGKGLYVAGLARVRSREQQVDSKHFGWRAFVTHTYIVCTLWGQHYRNMGGITTLFYALNSKHSSLFHNWFDVIPKEGLEQLNLCAGENLHNSRFIKGFRAVTGGR